MLANVFTADPWVIKAILRAIDYWATAGHTVQPTGEGKKVFAITTGFNGCRPGTLSV